MAVGSDHITATYSGDTTDAAFGAKRTYHRGRHHDGAYRPERPDHRGGQCERLVRLGGTGF